jgi:hypothetical protein
MDITSINEVKNFKKLVGFKAIKLVRPDEGATLLHLNYISIISQYIQFVSMPKRILQRVELSCVIKL